MGSENEDQVPQKSPIETKPENEKKSKVSYTRDFLLSLSEWDVCKKLPSGFDASILSDFEDSFNTVYERQRSSGGLSLHNSKRNEYGSLALNRSESSSSYTRGNQGRWDTRSSGSSDKDGDAQSDRESVIQDSGKHFGNQSRRPWQHPEHDGLLGSGAFPRPPGYVGPSAPKARGNGHYQLSRSTEPYHPPRPYKGVPCSRRESTDSFNDETFGSAECSSEDRAEEERKRRASFELMRKEQHKALQEKHKQKPNNNKENFDSDMIALLDNSAVQKSISRNKSDETGAASLSYNDTARSSSHLQAPASRPLVPPGFASTLMDKNISVQSSSTSLASEAGVALSEHNHSVNYTGSDQDMRNNPASCKHVNIQENESKGQSVLSVDANEKLEVSTPSPEVFEHTIGSGNVSSKTSCLQGANEVWEDDAVNDFSLKKQADSELINTASQDHSTTMLEKLFSSVLSKNCSSSPNNVEQICKPDEEAWNPAMSESSKFACWFSEEEKKPVDDISARDLLSLIVPSEKGDPQVSTSNELAIELIPPSLPCENTNSLPKLPASPATSPVIGFPEMFSQGDMKTPYSEALTEVLTCEDLEQSILAEVKDGVSGLQKAWAAVDDNSREQKADVDDHASHHLLSLLQKGTGVNESILSTRSDVFEFSDVKSSLNLQVPNNTDVRNAEAIHSSEQSLTLEALFGAAFMNALHSAEAPVSAQRGSVGTVNNNDAVHPQVMPMVRADDGFFSSTSNVSRPNKIFHEGEMLSLNDNQKAKTHSIAGLWMGGHGDSPVEGSKLGHVGIEEGVAVEIRLPEEDSLITVGDTLNPITADPFSFGNANKPGDLLSEKAVEDLNGKLLNAIFRDGERLRARVPDGSSLLNNSPYEVVDSENLHHQLNGRPSSQFPHQMNQPRPLFPQLDHPHRNPQIKFIGPDGMHHDPHRPFPTNVMPHHNFSSIGVQRFDPAAAHHPMLPHMPVPGNFPLHHPLQGLPRGVTPSHLMNQMPSYVPEMNNVHNFPLHHRQPNYGGGLGMGVPMPGSIGPGGGAGHSEALERLIEMERRANLKHIHPAGVGHHIPGIYGPELDMNLRYR